MLSREENKKRKRRSGKLRKKNNKFVRKRKESLPKAQDIQSEMAVWLTVKLKSVILLRHKTLN